MTGDPCGFLEEVDDGSGCADTATKFPSLCSGVVHPCGDVLEWLHAWGEKVEVCNVRRQI